MFPVTSRAYAGAVVPIPTLLPETVMGELVTVAVPLNTGTARRCRTRGCDRGLCRHRARDHQGQEHPRQIHALLHCPDSFHSIVRSFSAHRLRRSSVPSSRRADYARKIWGFRESQSRVGSEGGLEFVVEIPKGLVAASCELRFEPAQLPHEGRLDCYVCDNLCSRDKKHRTHPSAVSCGNKCCGQRLRNFTDVVATSDPRWFESCSKP